MFTKEELEELYDKMHDEYEEFMERYPHEKPEEITDRLFFLKYEKNGRTFKDLTNEERLALLREFRKTYVWKEHAEFIRQRRYWQKIGGRHKDKRPIEPLLS